MTARHLDRERMAEIAAGARPSADEAAHLATDVHARRELAAHDPSALFAILGSLPASAALPPLPAMPARSAERHRGRIALFGVAAASIAAAALLFAFVPPSTIEVDGAADPLVVADAGLGLPPAAASRARALPELVERVASPTARVVALVPPSADGPVITLVLDEGIDL